MKLANTAALAAALVSCLGAAVSNATMALTPAGTAAGFTLTTFASGFPSSGNSPPLVGPLGIAFPSAGGVLVTDYPRDVRLFPSDADGQTASSAVVGRNYGNTNAVGLVSLGSSFYMTEQGTGSVVQVNANGTLNQTIVTGLPDATGLVADPFTGHLFVSESNPAAIVDVNPATKTFTTFATPAVPDGLSLSADGSILYVESSGQIVGYNTASKSQVFSSGTLTASSSPDGTAVAAGVLTGNIFANTNDGKVIEINLATKAQTLIASGGSRGDFVTVDPTNGSLLLTQTDSILRLTGAAFAAHPIISLSPATPVDFGNQITAGTGTDKGTFTTGSNTLTVTGGHTSYLPAQVTGIDGGAGAAKDYVAVSGFNPPTDPEVFGLDVLVNGTQAGAGQIATLVADINSTNAYGYGSAIASATDPEAGDFQNLSPDIPYNLFLTVTGATSGSNNFAFDLTQDPTLGSTATVAAVAVVPEPAVAIVTVLTLCGLTVRKRSR
jgi:hypothetical protein